MEVYPYQSGRIQGFWLLYDILAAAEAIIESAGLIIVISGSARIIDISCIEDE